ncbi:hypothetical protein [Nocardia sp. NPDC050710]|uniref:hypothetical protein n=1 Tax=Nocardia sp. NPDC050710 TaxID=3157220 RepID=UPI0033EBD13D
MTKNGAQVLGTNEVWTEVPGWAADSAGYPGSVVVGNGLRANGSSSNAAITATLPFGSAGMSGNHQARLVLNGTTVLGTGAVVTGTSGTMTAAATVSLSDGDIVTVQVWHNISFQMWRATITAGAGTFVRIT